MKKKLKLTRLTVSDLDRVKGGDGPPVCFCLEFPNGSTDEAYRHEGPPATELFCTLLKTQCGGC